MALPANQPFDGIRVIDVTHVLAGPFCAYQLAVLGADVIKVEAPEFGNIARGRGPDDGLNAAGLGLNYLVQGSNKRSIAIDLTTSGGKIGGLDGSFRRNEPVHQSFPSRSYIRPGRLRL